MHPLSLNLPTPPTLLSRLVGGEASRPRWSGGRPRWSGGREGARAWEGPGGGPGSAPEAAAGPPTCRGSSVGRLRLPLPVCTGRPTPRGQPRLPRRRCFRLDPSPGPPARAASESGCCCLDPPLGLPAAAWASPLLWAPPASLLRPLLLASPRGSAGLRPCLVPHKGLLCPQGAQVWGAGEGSLTGHVYGGPEQAPCSTPA